MSNYGLIILWTLSGAVSNMIYRVHEMKARAFIHWQPTPISQSTVALSDTNSPNPRLAQGSEYSSGFPHYSLMKLKAGNKV